MLQHTPLFRRLIAAALGAAMLTTLAACSEKPAGTKAPQHSASATDSRWDILDLPQETDPTDSRWDILGQTQETDPTTAPTEEPVVWFDLPDLVVDAYRYIHKDDYGYEHCYHIPKVNLEICESVNSEIFRTLYEIIDRDANQSIMEYGEPVIGSTSYIWNRAEDIVSILVQIPDFYIDWADYRVYYVSVKTGAQVGQTELLAACGMSEEDFHAQVYTALEAYWDGMLESESFQENEQLMEMSRQMIEDTLADENIQAAVPFLNTDGSLSFLATVYVPAGGGVFQGLFDCGTGELLTGFSCTVDHDSPVVR